ncbi:hypothetical protein BHM03_00030143 [Ensete ventricosum]|nr:hypothetical protein BHM03_00030143 [Ensete ventricosum]
MPQADGRVRALVRLIPRLGPCWRTPQRQMTSSLTTFLRPEQHCPSGLATVFPFSTKEKQSARSDRAEEQSGEGAGAPTGAPSPCMMAVVNHRRRRRKRTQTPVLSPAIAVGT